MIPKKPAVGLDPRVDAGFRKIMLHQKPRASQWNSPVPGTAHRVIAFGFFVDNKEVAPCAGFF
jgi:hypothetical protein